MKNFTYGSTILLLAAIFTPPALADGNDPTAPSQQIADLLSAPSSAPAQPAGQQPAAQSKRPVVRLKAMVLRDRDNGSALITVGDGEPCVVPLSRNPLGVAGYHLAIAGERFLVVDFSKSHVLLRNVDSGMDLVVN